MQTFFERDARMGEMGQIINIYYYIFLCKYLDISKIFRTFVSLKKAGFQATRCSWSEQRLIP
jgi:hypothetical protein